MHRSHQFTMGPRLSPAASWLLLVLDAGFVTICQSFFCQDTSAGYDGDDDADLLSHVSETSSFIEAQNDGDSSDDTDAVSDVATPDEVHYDAI